MKRTRQPKERRRRRAADTPEWQQAIVAPLADDLAHPWAGIQGRSDTRARLTGLRMRFERVKINAGVSGCTKAFIAWA